MLGMDCGLKEFKPRRSNGGTKALQAIAGPFFRYVSAQLAVSPANYRDHSGVEKRVVHAVPAVTDA